MKKKVVLFVRVSTENQELESQIEALKQSAYIDGYSDDDLIVIAKKESGVKLKEAEREGLNELKRVIERNEIDGVCPVTRSPCIHFATISSRRSRYS